MLYQTALINQKDLVIFLIGCAMKSRWQIGVTNEHGYTKSIQECKTIHQYDNNNDKIES